MPTMLRLAFVFLITFAGGLSAYAQMAERQADQAFAAGLYEEAGRHYAQAATEQPARAAALRVKSAGAYYQAKAFEKASVQARQATGPYAIYLLGCALLELKRWTPGTRTLAGIKTQQAAQALYALLAPAPADTIRALAQKLPNTPGLAERLAALQAQSSNAAPGQSGPIRIAILLPFEANTRQSNPSQAMAEFAAAARLAAQDLKSQNLNIELYFYDTYRRLDSLQALLRLPELAQMDVLIGPIYPQGTPELAGYAAERQIPLINPLASQVRWPEPNAYTYLAEPSLTDMAAASLALRGLGQNVRVACIYGVSEKDSSLAAAFKALAAKNGCTLGLFKPVGKNSAANLTKFIREAALDSSSVLFVPNEEPLVKGQLVSALEIARMPGKTITYGDWLEDTELDLNRFERARMRFLYPTYKGTTTPDAEPIRKRIAQAYGLPPTEIGLKAYDLITVCARTLAPLSGQARKTFLRDYSPLRSALTVGYDYTESQTNARVPIYRLDAGRLVLE